MSEFHELKALIAHTATQLHQHLNAIEEKLMATTREELDAFLPTLLAAEAARDAAVLKAITDLSEKVTAGTVTTPEDFTAELTSLQSLATNAASITQTVTTADPGSTTPTAAAPVTVDATPATA